MWPCAICKTNLAMEEGQVCSACYKLCKQEIEQGIFPPGFEIFTVEEVKKYFHPAMLEKIKIAERELAEVKAGVEFLKTDDSLAQYPFLNIPIETELWYKKMVVRDYLKGRTVPMMQGAVNQAIQKAIEDTSINIQRAKLQKMLEERDGPPKQLTHEELVTSFRTYGPKS